jgi:glyoxylase-like metal-dependent hydrolase (beta-lactamase superfamily II)
LAAKSVFQIVNELHKSNTYIVEYKLGLAFVVDPGFDWIKIETYLTEQKLTPTHVFCTHGHFDHIGSVTQIVERYGANSTIHKADLKLAKTANFLMMAFGMEERINTPIFQNTASGGEIFKLGDNEFRIEHVPGHSPGSCFLFFKNLLFSGDTLYSNGIGLPSPEQDNNLLKNSLLQWWHVIPNETTVCPGHGQVKLLGDICLENKDLIEFLHKINE